MLWCPPPASSLLFVPANCHLCLPSSQVLQVMASEKLDGLKGVGPNNAYLREIKERDFKGIPWGVDLVYLCRVCKGETLAK